MVRRHRSGGNAAKILVMVRKILSKGLLALRHPNILPWAYREWHDRNFRSKRVLAAKRSLEKHHILPLLVGGDCSELPPSLMDLANIYEIVRKRCPKIVLEFGVGFSTIVIAVALRDNYSASKICGHLHSIDAEMNWIENTKNKLSKELEQYVTFKCSSVRIDTINSSLCHRYDFLPDISPNLIYVDGPAGIKVIGNIRGLSFSKGRPVIGSDILVYESTAPMDLFILVDGRWETCRFLRSNLKGRYRHRRYIARDYQTFEYIGEPMYS